MRSLILGAALLCASAHADLVFRQGNDSVRLTEADCTHAKVRELLPAGHASEFRAARAQVQGAPFAACWVKVGEVAFVIYEDGDQGAIPVEMLKEEQGI